VRFSLLSFLLALSLSSLLTIPRPLFFPPARSQPSPPPEEEEEEEEEKEPTPRSPEPEPEPEPEPLMQAPQPLPLPLPKTGIFYKEGQSTEGLLVANSAKRAELRRLKKMAAEREREREREAERSRPPPGILDRFPRVQAGSREGGKRR